MMELIINYYARDTIGKVYRMFNQYGIFKPLVFKKLGRPATIRQFSPPCFVLGLIGIPLISLAIYLLGIPSLILFSKFLLGIYFAVLWVYVLLATCYSLKSTRNPFHIFIQDWVYLVVHFAYGWGYLIGLYKLLSNGKYRVNVNR